VYCSMIDVSDPLRRVRARDRLDRGHDAPLRADLDRRILRRVPSPPRGAPLPPRLPLRRGRAVEARRATSCRIELPVRTWGGVLPDRRGPPQGRRPRLCGGGVYKAHEFGFASEPGCLSSASRRKGRRRGIGDPTRAVGGRRTPRPIPAARCRGGHRASPPAISKPSSRVSRARRHRRIIRGHCGAGGGARVRGAMLLAEGDARERCGSSARAREGWREVGAPFELAEVRTLIGRAHAAAGGRRTRRSWSFGRPSRRSRTSAPRPRRSPWVTCWRNCPSPLRLPSASAGRSCSRHRRVDRPRQRDRETSLGEPPLVARSDAPVAVRLARWRGRTSHRVTGSSPRSRTRTPRSRQRSRLQQRARGDRKEHGLRALGPIGFIAPKPRVWPRLQAVRRSQAGVCAAADRGILRTEETALVPPRFVRTSDPRAISAKGSGAVAVGALRGGRTGPGSDVIPQPFRRSTHGTSASVGLSASGARLVR
jgi:hypothetical protein